MTTSTFPLLGTSFLRTIQQLFINNRKDCTQQAVKPLEKRIAELLKVLSFAQKPAGLEDLVAFFKEIHTFKQQLTATDVLPKELERFLANTIQSNWCQIPSNNEITADCITVQVPRSHAAWQVPSEPLQELLNRSRLIEGDTEFFTYYQNDPWSGMDTSAKFYFENFVKPFMRNHYLLLESVYLRNFRKVYN